MLGEAKVIGALVEFGLAEREAAMEGIIFVDLRTEVGSKKTAPGAVSSTMRTEQDPSYQVYFFRYSGTRCL